ncbi:MAG: HIT domain-containing protein [Candidatus Micrarchaeota archaeon]
MENCIFCKIVEGKEKSFKLYEDKKYIAILDRFPNIMGQTLVITKDHINSYAFDLSEKELCELMKVTKKVAKMLEKGLKVKRVHMVIEGTAINHLHVKLYPAIGMKSKNKKLIADDRIYFDEYKGYITTLLGPKADEKDLKEVQNKILNADK